MWFFRFIWLTVKQLNIAAKAIALSIVRYGFLVMPCLTLGLAGCQKAGQNQATAVVNHQQGAILHYAPAPLQAEQLLSLQVDLRQLEQRPAHPVQHIKGVLRGINLDMGVMPLVFKPDGALWRSEFMLGACTEPAMQWQLELIVVFEDGSQRVIHDRFISQR
jgi:hypothetical protein